MTAETVAPQVHPDEPRFVQAEIPTCAKCGKPMSFMQRQIVTAVCTDVVLYHDAKTDESLVSVDTEYCDEVDWEITETWWACGSFDCYRTLQKAGEDFPYEEGFEGTVDWA